MAITSKERLICCRNAIQDADSYESLFKAVNGTMAELREINNRLALIQWSDKGKYNHLVDLLECLARHEVSTETFCIEFTEFIHNLDECYRFKEALANLLGAMENHCDVYGYYDPKDITIKCHLDNLWVNFNEMPIEEREKFINGKW